MRGDLVKKLASTLFAILLSAVALWWLLGDGEGAALMEAARHADPWPLVAGAAIAIGIQMIRAWRFALLATGDLALPSRTMIGIASKLVLLNFLLPFKLGELSFPLMMRRTYGTPFGEGAGILILCRLLDFGVVAGIILLGAAWLLDPALHGLPPGFLAALGLLALAAPFLAASFLPVIQRLAGLHPFMMQMSLGLARMRAPGPRFLSAGLTLAIWLAHAMIAYLTAIALAADLGFPSMAMASASSNLAFALPISGVAGLGPPQAAWASVLHFQGVDWTPAITSALICHGVLLVTLSIFGLATWIGQTAGSPAPARPDLARD